MVAKKKPVMKPGMKPPPDMLGTGDMPPVPPGKAKPKKKIKKK